MAADSWEREIGLVALSEDVSTEVVVDGYRNGVFPWPLLGESGPILWCSPDPRFVLLPEDLHVPRSLRRTLRRGGFRITVDRAFEHVIAGCASVPRPAQEGTWITTALRRAYVQLHHDGWAHSVEVWTADDELAGGLYGVAMGAVFFGESMFSRVPDASKVALVSLVAELRRREYDLVDCQQRTDHMGRFGAREMPRAEFLRRLRGALGRAPRFPRSLEAEVL